MAFGIKAIKDFFSSLSSKPDDGSMLHLNTHSSAPVAAAPAAPAAPAVPAPDAPKAP